MSTDRTQLATVEASEQALSGLDPETSGRNLRVELTREEVGELTERALEASARSQGAQVGQISLDQCLSILRAQALPDAAIEEAVQGLLRDRAERLSNVIARKAHELERMLFSVLPRLDTTFQARATKALSASGSSSRRQLQYQVRAERGCLRVVARYDAGDGYPQRLFELVARAAHKASFWERLDSGRDTLPRRVRVRALTFSGHSLAEFLIWTVQQRAAGTELGEAVARAIELLGPVLQEQSEAAVRYLTELSFEGPTE